MTDDRQALSEQLKCRTCVWCEEVVPERKDGRLRVHYWDVRQGGITPVMGTCVGSGTSEADAEEAQR